MLNKFLKNILAYILVFFVLEIFFTMFFIFYSDYYGPLTRFMFSGNKITDKKITVIQLNWNKFTNRMNPGEYELNNVKYKINSKGFRGEEFTIKNSKNCRIISFGGSITLGIQIEKPYTKILEENLRKDKIDCEVLNFALASKGLNFIEKLLIEEAINYSPNYISIMMNRNATMYDSYGSSSLSPDVIEDNVDLNMYLIKNFLSYKIMTFRFIDKTFLRIISLFYNRENKIVNPYDSQTFHLKNYFTNKYINQMTNIINFCKKKGIKVILVKQAHFINPTYQKKIKSLSKDETLNKLLNYHKSKKFNKNDLFWIYTNRILNKSLDEIKKNNPEVIIVDPIDKLFDSKKSINFIDGIHLNYSGHQIVAEEVLKSIKPLFLKN